MRVNCAEWGSFSIYVVLPFSGSDLEMDDFTILQLSLDDGVMRGMETETDVPLARPGGEEIEPTVNLL